MNNQNQKTKNDLKIRSYLFSIDVIKFLSSIPKNDIIRVITNQLLRSATSIGANIVEAKASSSKREFAKFYQISLKSCNETLYWLCLLRDTQNIDTRKLLKECEEIGKMLGSNIITLKGKKKF